MKTKKRDGTPEKSATPNMSQDALQEEEQQNRNVLFNEEIEKLSIKPDDLAKVDAFYYRVLARILTNSSVEIYMTNVSWTCHTYENNFAMKHM